MTTTDPTPEESSAEAKIEDNRDALEDIADSDLPVAWVADELLAIADDGGGVTPTDDRPWP